MNERSSPVSADTSRYHVIRRVAIGGMGEIFLARQAIAGVNRLVVLKRLLPELAEDPQLLAMFVDEARIAANLAHPGIVQVHEFGQDDQGYFIVMEYVPGHNLGRMLTRATRDGYELPPRVGAFICYEVARALDHAHHACDSDGKPLEIVHRDISPSNVLVSFRGDVKLMDFGIARATNRAHRTSDGRVRGKVAYMPPEQIEGGEVDAKTDVFAIGVVLWELTLRRRLFDGSNDIETIRAALEAPIPRPTTLDPYYPPALEAIVMAALERDRTSRLPSAADLAARLKAFLREQPADRDEVAAAMSTLFADEAAESLRLEREHTTALSPARNQRDLVPTVALAMGEVPPATEPAKRRWAWALVLLLLVAGGGGIGWYVYANRAPMTATGAVAQAGDAVQVATAPGDAGSDVATATSPDAASVVIATPVDVAKPRGTGDHVGRGGKHGGNDRGRGHGSDARDGGHGSDQRSGPVSDSPPVVPEPTLVTVAFGPAPGQPRADIHIDRHPGLDCGDATSLPMVCKMTAGAHDVHIRVPGGGEFDAHLDVAAGTRRCYLDLSTQRISCS